MDGEKANKLHSDLETRAGRPCHLGAALLQAGKLVAFPTETVYGLGADATSDAAVNRIFTAKGRPATNPLIVHVADISAAKKIVTDWPDIAEKLATAFWPGPLTLVLPKATCISSIATAGGSTVGVRVPNHPLALALLREVGLPIAAPSANSSERISPTTAEHVRLDLGDKVDFILDGGPCEVGIESTVIDLTTSPPMILRPGGVSRAQIEAIIGPVNLPSTLSEPNAKSPGRSDQHYAPRKPAYRFETGAMPGAPVGVSVISLATMPRDPEPYATALYGTLRKLDESNASEIWAELPPDEPQWLAVRDRLLRATRPIGDGELTCPLCGYSLRGLAEPRCPECGFKFQWHELREAKRTRHPYLFEHGSGHNIRSFWLTFWRDCRPRRFWRELSPANPINLRRLIVYWLLSNIGLLVILPAMVGVEAWQLNKTNTSTRAYLSGPQVNTAFAPGPGIYKRPTPQQLQTTYPTPKTLRFWKQLMSHLTLLPISLPLLVIGLLWTPFSLATLMIFQGTMRRNNIHRVHLLRCAIYSCDFTILIAILLSIRAISFYVDDFSFVAILAVVATYRLWICNREYLRVELPLLIAISSQIILALLGLIAIVNFGGNAVTWFLVRWFF